MCRVLVIADDLTGANDTGVMFAKQGLKVYTVLNREENAERTKNCDCLSLSTDSRGLSSAEAYERVSRAVKIFGGKDTVLYSKRIDSTLRGNLGAETDAVLDALGDDRMAVIVPAFPRAGRSYVGGHLLVYGRPLFRTAAATDPKNPVCTASALKLYEEQSSRKAAEIYLEQLKDGAGRVAERIRRKYAEGIRCLIFDGAEDSDLLTVAEGVTLSRVPFVAVDPGAFSAVLCQVLWRKESEMQKKILFAVGSVNEVAVRQTKELTARPDTARVLLDAKEILKSTARAQRETARAAAEALKAFQACPVCAVCTSGILPENRIDLAAYAAEKEVSPDDVSSLLNKALGETVTKILEKEPGIRGLFACGGDAAMAVCNELGVEGEYPLDEVVPLAVYGKFSGGLGDGLHVITKGGMVGDDGTMIRCLEYLRERISRRNI